MAAKQDTSVIRWPPVVPIVVGLLLIFVFAIACLMSMQTTEAWILGLQAKLAPDATIALQVPKFLDGSLDEDTAIAFFIAFIVQLVLLITKIGLPTVHAYIAKRHVGKPSTEAMEKSAKARMTIWQISQYICLGINAWSDLIYSWHLGYWQSFIFTGVMFVGTFYFGTWGVQMIVSGIDSGKEN